MSLPKINDRFNTAIQKTAQERKVAELQAEIDRLRAAQSPELEHTVQNLRQQLQHTGEVQIPVYLIDPNPQQPRQTITEAAVRAKARTLAKDKQITPVILIPTGDRYTLLDGQLRWSAAIQLGWETIRAVVVPVPKDINRDSLLTFLHFEDLNPLDKAEAIIREIHKAIKLEAEEISTILGTVLKRIERDGSTKKLANLVNLTAVEQQQALVDLGVREREQDLLLILLDLGLNPGSVKANLLPMLYLPPDLKASIREQGLKGAHALALKELSAKPLNLSEHRAAKERMVATAEVLEKELTVTETRKLVSEIKQQFAKIPDNLPDSIPNRLQLATQQLKKTKVWKDPQKQAKIEALLTQLEELIN